MCVFLCVCVCVCVWVCVCVCCVSLSVCLCMCLVYIRPHTHTHTHTHTQTCTPTSNYLSLSRMYIPTYAYMMHKIRHTVKLYLMWVYVCVWVFFLCCVYFCLECVSVCVVLAHLAIEGCDGKACHLFVSSEAYCATTFHSKTLNFDIILNDYLSDY